MGYHAELAPSSAERWTSCTASINAQRGLPNKSTVASREGTCGHLIAEECLTTGADPSAYIGKRLIFWRHDPSDTEGEDWADSFPVKPADDVEYKLNASAAYKLTMSSTCMKLK